MNKQGRRTLGLLTKLREAQDNAEDAREGRRLLNDDDILVDFGDIEEIEDLIKDGVGFAGIWAERVHGEATPTPAVARRVKSGWQAWGRAGMTLCRGQGVKVSRLGAFTGRA